MHQLHHVPTIEISLPELIQLLVATDIRRIEYDQELLINLLISNGVDSSNVAANKHKMISILEDCRFPKNRAEYTVDQILRNFGPNSSNEEEINIEITVNDTMDPIERYRIEMREELPLILENIKQVDKNTKNLVRGFIRETEKECDLENIPSLVITTCILFHYIPPEPISLPELIQLLVATDIRPIEYDQELLINLLISEKMTNSNVVYRKDKMISILEDCRFPRNRAEFTTEQILKNFQFEKK